MALSELEEKTLLLLANYGPLAGYDLHSKKRSDGSGEKAKTNIMSDVYWLEIRKKLDKMKLIRELPKDGRRKPYKLSEDGFDLVIRSHLDDIHDFDNFAKHHEEYFPLVLGHWKELKKSELDGYVKDNLKKSVKNVYFDVVKELMLKKRERYSHGEFIRDLSARIYIPEIFEDCEEIYDGVTIDKIIQFRDKVSEIKKFKEKWIGEEKVKSYKYIEGLERARAGTANRISS